MSLRSWLPVWARDRLALPACSPPPRTCTSPASTPSTPRPRTPPPARPSPTPSSSPPTTSAPISPPSSAPLRALPPALAERTELLIVDDDSQDGTVEEVARLRADGYPRLELLTRPRAGGESGLSSAVLRGFERARGARLVVMDADLQHPPSAIPALLAALGEDDDDDKSDSGEGEGEGKTKGKGKTKTKTPMALGTRYGRGVAMDANWPMYRRVISWGARVLARPLTTASDPMTGFFAVRRDAFLTAHPLSPLGFKIALELLLSIPNASRPPEAATIARYVLQLLHLYRRALGVFWHLLVGRGWWGVCLLFGS
ncbi:nucleotide-diphospho-sugar transferase [Mycena leptocephala]|nr:nucleotide-diphospho-sugar transferase [Mycena leptocephala]